MMNDDIINALREMQASGEAYVVATVIETTGSVSATMGSKTVIDHHGDTVSGWIGGGCAESITRQVALDTMSDGHPKIITLDMNDEVLGTGMPCGGSMRVFIEPILPARRLWILGHGRVAECLCELAAFMKLKVTVIDPNAEQHLYPLADQLIVDDWNYERLTPRAEDFVVIATQHKGDHQSMKQALTTSVRYIALIASRKRSKLVMKYLREDGFNDLDLSRVYAPAGLGLGARTPEGIALSVIAEIVAHGCNGNGAAKREPFENERLVLLQKPTDEIRQQLDGRRNSVGAG
jgi:xanthine dehydrogenase accessory factor